MKPIILTIFDHYLPILLQQCFGSSLIVREKSVGTTELHYSTKKRKHSFSILKARTEKKSFQYAKRMFPLFRAIVKFIDSNGVGRYVLLSE